MKTKKFLQIVRVNKKPSNHICSFINPFAHLDLLDSNCLSTFTPIYLGICLVAEFGAGGVWFGLGGFFESCLTLISVVTRGAHGHSVIL